MAKAEMPSTPGVVLEYKAPATKPLRASREDVGRRTKKVAEAKRLRQPATA